MPGRSPAGPLIREHREVDRVLALLAAQRASMAERGEVDTKIVGRSVEFMHTYVDRGHHGKEEAILFPALESKGMEPPLVATMETLVKEHERGRALVARLGEANLRLEGGDSDAMREMIESIDELNVLYPKHVDTEERHFFKPAIDYLTDEERARMLRDYVEFDAGVMHERYRSVVEGLEKAAGGLERMTAGATR